MKDRLRPPLKGGWSRYLDRMVIRPIAPYEDCRFTQCVDRDQPLLLVQGNKKTGTILWRNTTTGEEFLTPNIWYNQPVEWRIEAMNFESEQARKIALKLRIEKAYRGWREDADAAVERSIRCLNLAEEMARTGKVLA